MLTARELVRVPSRNSAQVYGIDKLIDLTREAASIPQVFQDECPEWSSLDLSCWSDLERHTECLAEAAGALTRARRR